MYPDLTFIQHTKREMDERIAYANALREAREAKRSAHDSNTRRSSWWTSVRTRFF